MIQLIGVLISVVVTAIGVMSVPASFPAQKKKQTIHYSPPKPFNPNHSSFLFGMYTEWGSSSNAFSRTFKTFHQFLCSWTVMFVQTNDYCVGVCFCVSDAWVP